MRSALRPSTLRSSPTPTVMERTRYGALPWRRTKQGEIKILLVTSRDEERWQLPSALTSDDRTPRQMAMTEAFEKAGVFGHLDPNPLGSYTSVLARPSTVVLYGLKVRGTLTHWPERVHRKRRWFFLNDAANAVMDLELKRLFSSLDANPGFLEPLREAA